MPSNILYKKQVLKTIVTRICSTRQIITQIKVGLTNGCIWEWKLTSFEIKKDILEHKKDLISVRICQEGNKGNVYF